MAKARPAPRAVAAARPRARGDAASRPLKVAKLPRPPFDFVDSKIRVPALRPGTVSRTGLVNRLRATTASATVVTVTAPAGYGKTTLLAQWAARDSRPFAWVSIDERDNDPIVFLRHLAASLGRIAPLPPAARDPLRGRSSAAWRAAVPRLAALLADEPIVVVLDDFNFLRSRESLNAVNELLMQASEGSMVVLAGRAAPRLRVAALRAAGRLVEMGVDELALTRREARLLLVATGIELSPDQQDDLIEQCEGWPAALYLAALAVRDGHERDREPIRFAGDDRYLADYFRSEYLSRLRPGPLRFLRRTSVLAKMSGSLCDAVLDDDGSAIELEKIERSNLFLVPLDHRREWYRYHHLFRDLLQRELCEREPQLVAILHKRAADWYEAHDEPESALDHAFNGSDVDRAAAILTEVAVPMYCSGRVATLERWLARFDTPERLERYPVIALVGSRVHALRGHPKKAERWLNAVEASAPLNGGRQKSSSVRAWYSVAHASFCRFGAQQMLADAEAALDELPDSSFLRPTALLLKGCALALLGEIDGADAVLQAASDTAVAMSLSETAVIALSERALVAAERQDHTAVEDLSRQAHQVVADSGIDGYPGRAIELAVSARVHLRHGRWDEARADLEVATQLVPLLTKAVPWLAVRTRLEVARGLITLRDRDAARLLVSEAEELLRQRPGLGLAAAQARELARAIDSIPEPETGNFTGLTTAELRLLPLLATHLSFREIADQLHVSRNTIKTQAISVYRKLGVSSRSDAIAEATRLGLGA